MSEAVEHEADHGEGDHRLGDLGPLLVILRQAPPSPEPTDGSFDHPPAWQQDEALSARDAADDNQRQAEQKAGEQDGEAVVDAVGEHGSEPLAAGRRHSVRVVLKHAISPA